MQGQVRPPRLVDYFLTVGAADTNNLIPYRREQKDDDFFNTQSNEVITDLCIVPSDRDEDVPPDYECISTTIQNNYAGLNAGGYFHFNFNKHNGPFIAFKRAHAHNRAQSTDSTQSQSVLPITNIAIRDVDEYLKLNPHLMAKNNANDSDKDTQANTAKKNIKSKAASSLMSSFKKRLSVSNKTPKIELDSDNGGDNSDSHYSLPPPVSTHNTKWELVAGNLNKGSLGHKLEIWIQRDCDCDPIIDLAVINHSKNETVPHGFRRVTTHTNKEISLNEGATHRDQICLFLKTRNMYEYAHCINIFRAAIMDRYPLRDYDEFKLTEAVAPFCFPRGMEVIPGATHKHKRTKKRHKKHSNRNKSVSIHRRQSAEVLDFDIHNLNVNDSDCFEDIDPSIESESTEEELSDEKQRMNAYENAMKIHESHSHTFVLSSELGTRIYGACIIFYEECAVSKGSPYFAMESHQYSTVHIPKGICVLSHYPFYNGFLLFLNDIYCLSLSPANRVPVEKYISHFFHSVPLPLCGHPGVQYSIGTKKHTFKINARYNLRRISFPFDYLFRCLSIEDIIALIGFILLEKQIVLISQIYSLLTPCAEALRTLLWPFEYQYNFIPILPESFARILEAPVPFIFGMHRSLYDQLIVPKDVITVDLDQHCLSINRRAVHSYKKKELIIIPKPMKNRLKVRLIKYVKLDMIDGFSASKPPLHLNDNEYFNVEAVRLSFVQLFVDTFRFYRNYLVYEASDTTEMRFESDKFVQSLPENVHTFVAHFLKTHSFQRFINLRCSKDIHKQNCDLITFDYFICKTMQSISSELNVTNLSKLDTNHSSTVTAKGDEDSSSTTTTTRSTTTTNTTNTSKKTNSKKQKNHNNSTIFVDLECDLMTQMNESQLEDPYIIYEPYIVKSADTNPSKQELKHGFYKYESFPTLERALMAKYYSKSKRNQIRYDKTNGTETNTIDTAINESNGAPNFQTLPFADPTHIQSMKASDMDESYAAFIAQIIIGFNRAIDCVNKHGGKYSAKSPFLYRQCKTKTMNNTVSNFIHKIYETWLSIFAHHSINRLSIHSVSPKRDFIQCLLVLERMLRRGYRPTELVMRELSVIPAHCAMYKELILCDRWMIRLGLNTSLKYLQQIINGNARRSHVEYRKFSQYYSQTRLPLPLRTEYSFHDQDPTDSYPFNHCCDCEPESFFDYFCTDLPNKLLLSCKCQQCKHRLSGEEILAGFQNIKISTQNPIKKNNIKKLSKSEKEQKNELKKDNLTVTFNDQKSEKSEKTKQKKMTELGGLPKMGRMKRSNSDITQIKSKYDGREIKISNSNSISENPHLPQMKMKRQSRHSTATATNAQMKMKMKLNRGGMRRSGQWTTLCPFCSEETVAKIEIFGGVIPSEFKAELNKFMSFTIMNGAGLTKADNNNRKTFNLFCYERLHERIQRIINNAYPYYPTTKLPYSFPKLSTEKTGQCHTQKSNIKSQDRAIKIIRSKEELFWNVFFYFNLLSLPSQFLFGGNSEFQPRLKYNLAALPHHSWCFINEGRLQSNHKKRDGLEKYYECDKILKRLHQTLYFSLKPMIKDRLYDALILVLQQRGVITDEKISNGKNGTVSVKKKKMHNFVMNQPLYRLLGKLTSDDYSQSRVQSLLFCKSYNKSCERLSYTHKTRLILPQDKGIANHSFANRIQDILLLVNDTYHCTEVIKSEVFEYDINPHKFHIILQNHTHSQLVSVDDKALQQIQHLLRKQREKESKEREFEERKLPKYSDFLFDEARQRPMSETNMTNLEFIDAHPSQGKKRRESQPIDLRDFVCFKQEKSSLSHKRSEDSQPSKKFWKVVSNSLNAAERRRHSVEHPCYVPRLRKILNNQFWLSQYRWYIYYYQPRRMKYIYFILLIQKFYQFRFETETVLPLPETFSFYFANNNNETKKRVTHKRHRKDHSQRQREIESLLTFDLRDMNADTQQKLDLLQYSQFIYYHFVHSMASYKIQFSDKSIVKYIEDCLFDSDLSFKTQIDVKIFDKMWNAVFRYLHQMTYEPFVIWMNTK